MIQAEMGITFRFMDAGFEDFIDDEGIYRPQMNEGDLCSS